jgi:hypothetical protein
MINESRGQERGEREALHTWPSGPLIAVLSYQSRIRGLLFLIVQQAIIVG